MGIRYCPQMSHIHTWTHRGHWFLPSPLEVQDSYPDLQRSWLKPSSSEVPDSHLDPDGSWLRSTPFKVPDSLPEPQRSLVLAHLLSICSPVPAPRDFAVSGLLQVRLLPQSCLCKISLLWISSHSRGACHLRPTPLRSLGQSSSCGACYLRPVPS